MSSFLTLPSVSRLVTSVRVHLSRLTQQIGSPTRWFCSSVASSHWTIQLLAEPGDHSLIRATSTALPRAAAKATLTPVSKWKPDQAGTFIKDRQDLSGVLRWSAISAFPRLLRIRSSWFADHPTLLLDTSALSMPCAIASALNLPFLFVSSISQSPDSTRRPRSNT